MAAPSYGGPSPSVRYATVAHAFMGLWYFDTSKLAQWAQPVTAGVHGIYQQEMSTGAWTEMCLRSSNHVLFLEKK